MKAATLAPIFAAYLYPRLAEAARGVGYALAVHGSLGRDYDLIAVPWTDEAQAPEVLIEALEKTTGAWAAEYANTGEEPEPVRMPRLRPHGRLAWLVYFKGGAGYLDVSVMPRSAPGATSGDEGAPASPEDDR